MTMTVSQAFEALESLVKYAGIASDAEALMVLREAMPPSRFSYIVGMAESRGDPESAPCT